MRKEKVFIKTIPAPKQTKKELEEEKKQRESEQKWLDNWLTSCGVNVPLKEWKKILDEKGTNYVEFSNVKSFLIPKIEGGYSNKDIEKKDIGTILIFITSIGHPKSGGTSGCSGYRGGKPKWIGDWSLHSYKLTKDEITDALKNFKGFGENIRLNSKNEYFLSLEYRSDCESDIFMKAVDILRKKAEEKFEKQNRTKTYVFYINGIIFDYTTKVRENISSYSEDMCYNYYFYDKDGNYLDLIPTPCLYG